MKKLLLVFISLLISNFSLAHRQHVHQRLSIEGYNLLKKWLGSDIVLLRDHVGTYTDIGNNPWEKGYLTTGAWREDTEDPVYNYSIYHPPTISGFLPNLTEVLGWALGLDGNDGFISSTHFWNADGGDNLKSDLRGDLIGDWPFQFTIENAYQKIKAYQNGYWDLDPKTDYIFKASDGRKARLYNSIGENIRIIQYRDLINLYKTGNVYVNLAAGRYYLQSDQGNTTQFSHLGGWLCLQLNYEMKNKIVFEILGRMCHLLQDVGSPAHSNVDPHGAQGLRHDSFEEYFGDIGWTADMVYNQNPTKINPYVSPNPIHFLMYTTQQQANHFASNGEYMAANCPNNTFGGNPTNPEITYLNSLNVSNYGLPVTMQENIPKEQVENMQNKLFPQIIRATAGLLYWFVIETDLLPFRVPQDYPTLQEALAVTPPGKTIAITSNITLSDNSSIPSGITLLIPSGVSVNLLNGTNRFSIISTGGTIIKESGAIIQNLRARLWAGPTLRGLCGTIQAAVNNAGSTNDIDLENGNFNENVNIYNKYNLTINGNMNYQPFGSLTITSCTAFDGFSFIAKNLSINNCSFLALYDVYAYGTNQSTIGFYLFNCETEVMSYLNSNYSRVGISCSDGTEADIIGSYLINNLAGLESLNGSSVSIHNSSFYGTALDLKVYNFSSIRASSCCFDGGIPSISTSSGSSISHSDDHNCSPSKAASNQLTENKMDNIEGSEFEKLNSAYYSLNKKLAKAFKGKTDFDKEAFCTDYDKVIKDFREYIGKNPEAPSAIVALVATAKSYRRIDDLRGKKDFADMKNFLSGILGKSEYATLKPQAERLMMEYYRLAKDFKKAIETADNLIKNYKEDADYLSGVLYAKGLIEAYDLNQPDIAAKTFSNILQQYPENSLAVLAKNELKILGKEVNEKITSEDEIASNKIELNNYPNPFNPVTTITYSLPVDGKVVIRVYDILGREIKELINEFKTAGKYSVQFDGNKLSSGVYFCRMESGKYLQTKKFILAK